MYFDNAEVGDRVYDIKYKWGIIRKINAQLIFVEFDNFKKSNGRYVQYDFNGKENGYLADYFGQTLFWNELEFELPKKPFNLKKFFDENFSSYIDPEEDKYHLEYKQKDGTWKFIKDREKTIVGSYYFSLNSAYEASELAEILNKNEIRYDQVCVALKEIKWNYK